MTYAPSPAPAPARNPLALVSLILGATAVLLAVVFVFLQAALIRGDVPMASIGLLSGVHAFLSAALGLGAIATGTIALFGDRPRKPLAAAGVALGASEVFSAILGLLTGLIYSLG